MTLPGKRVFEELNYGEPLQRKLLCASPAPVKRQVPTIPHLGPLGDSSVSARSKVAFVPERPLSSSSETQVEDNVYTPTANPNIIGNYTLLRGRQYAVNSSCDSASDLSSGNVIAHKRNISRPGSVSSTHLRRHQVPAQDLAARGRCFEYIVQSIDEVWARYVDTTSNAEVKVYLEANRTSSTAWLRQDSETLALNSGESDFEDLTTVDCESKLDEPTEYDTDDSANKAVSELPYSKKLQSLKKRLVNAKDCLEDLCDSEVFSDCVSFWRRWDMIKYSAVELMEDDDDDEVIECTIAELERGRCFFE